MRSSIGWDDAEAVVRLDELKHRLRRHHDFTDEAVADQWSRTDDARDAPQRRIVLVAERLRLRHRVGLVKTPERLGADALTLSLPVDGGRLCGSEIVPGPPYASPVRMTVSRAWDRLRLGRYRRGADQGEGHDRDRDDECLLHGEHPSSVICLRRVRCPWVR